MGDVTRISPAEALVKMKDEGFVYIDVRSPSEFADGHPEGAINVPFDEDFIGAMKKMFAVDEPIVVGCQVGGRSLRAARALAEVGFTRVVDQRAGWDGARGPFGEVIEPGWSRLGLPSTTE